MGSELESLLLDTHIWYRWQHDPGKLSRVQFRALERAKRREAEISVSCFSLWELAFLGSRGRIKVNGMLKTWLEEMAESPLVKVIPITPLIAAQGAQLGAGFPSDPADRIIVATALCHHLTLLTADERIRGWGGVSVI
jgi:PIN domain nuclease of toxin-antitoxin system